MMLNLLSVVGNDKFIEHPVLGSISCGGMYEAFKRCNELLNTSGSLPIQCRSLHDISLTCYKKKNSEEVYQWLDQQIDERRRLYRFLKQEKSLLPELEASHAVFDLNVIEPDDMKKQMNQKVEEYIQKESKNNKRFF